VTKTKPKRPTAKKVSVKAPEKAPEPSHQGDAAAEKPVVDVQPVPGAAAS